MQRRTISIADIARAAGVSHSTVSRALRDSPLISAEVRERIRLIADDMGYMPNGIAQSLQTQRSQTIGLVVTSIGDPFFDDIMRGVEEMARPAGYSVFLSASHNDPDEEIRAIETLHRRRVDGVIVAASRIGQEHAPRIARMRVPTVLINGQSESPDEQMHTARIDDEAGARMAVEHLLALGHRAIGYLGAGNRPLSNRRRLAAYGAALRDAGIAPDPAWQVVAPSEDTIHDDDVAAGQALVHALTQAAVTAIFCYNDMLAVGALLGCRTLGIAVPADLSIVGFDDIALAEYVTPPLTTIRQPRRDLGRSAMTMLLDLLDDRPAQHTLFTPTLVVRHSTAPKP